MVRSGKRAAAQRLIDERLCLIEHFALRPDRGIAIPRASLIACAREPNSLLVAWLASDGKNRSARLSRFARRVGGPGGAAVAVVAGRYAELDLDAVHLQLTDWML